MGRQFERQPAVRLFILRRLHTSVLRHRTPLELNPGVSPFLCDPHWPSEPLYVRDLTAAIPVKDPEWTTATKEWSPPKKDETRYFHQEILQVP